MGEKNSQKSWKSSVSGWLINGISLEQFMAGHWKGNIKWREMRRLFIWALLCRFIVKDIRFKYSRFNHRKWSKFRGNAIASQDAILIYGLRISKYQLHVLFPNWKLDTCKHLLSIAMSKYKYGYAPRPRPLFSIDSKNTIQGTVCPRSHRKEKSGWRVTHRIWCTLYVRT